MEFSALTTSIYSIHSLSILNCSCFSLAWGARRPYDKLHQTFYINACSLDSFCPLLLRNHLKRQDTKEISGVSAQLKDLNPKMWNEKKMQNYQQTRWKWYRIPQPAFWELRHHPNPSFKMSRDVSAQRSIPISAHQLATFLGISSFFEGSHHGKRWHWKGEQSNSMILSWWSDGGGSQTFWKFQHAHLQVRFLYWRGPDSKIGS